MNDIQAQVFYRCYDRNSGKFLPLIGACTCGAVYNFESWDSASTNLDRWCKRLPNDHILTIIKVTQTFEDTMN